MPSADVNLKALPSQTRTTLLPSSFFSKGTFAPDLKKLFYELLPVLITAQECFPVCRPLGALPLHDYLVSTSQIPDAEREVW